MDANKFYDIRMVNNIIQNKYWEWDTHTYRERNWEHNAKLLTYVFVVIAAVATALKTTKFELSNALLDCGNGNYTVSLKSME